jgi:hypothetical protein
MFPWATTGMTANRRWVYAPSPEILRARWAILVGEDDPDRKNKLLKATGDRTIDSVVKPLPRGHAHRGTLRNETGTCPEPRRVSYRSFDRQWVIPDRRVIDRPRADLWDSETDGQVFINEQHAQPIGPGPAITLAAFLTETDHFKGSEGGRVLPMLHPDKSGNLAPGLADQLSQRLGIPVTARELTAYSAAIAAHPAFTARFQDELQTPGVRIPITDSPRLFRDAVALGNEVIWAATYGAAAADPDHGRPAHAIAFPPGDDRRVTNLTAIDDRLPNKITYDESTQIIYIGEGTFGPVTSRMWEYSISGRNVIRHWFSYRKANPGGKKTSPLDDIHIDRWPLEWVTEFNELLTALRRITDLEPQQAALLDQILDGPIITGAQLAAAGVRFPQSAKDRKPRSDINTTDGGGQGTLI